MKVKSFNLKVNYLKESVKIPIVEVGNFEKGFVVLIGQLHGDEYSSRLIINKILEKADRIECGVRIFVCANVRAAIQGQKTGDNKVNYNRIFIEEKILNPDSLDYCVAQKIADLCKGAKFVIDLHDMPGSRLALASILTLTKNTKINQENYSLIKMFNPDVVWLEDFRKSIIRNRYLGTINSYLNSIGIPNFTLETNPIDVIKETEIVTISNKIINLVGGGSLKTNLGTKIVERIEIRSPLSGIFIPSPIKILLKINREQVLGKIITDNLKIISIKSPSGGILIRRCYKKNVLEGEKIVDIGKEIPW